MDPKTWRRMPCLVQRFRILNLGLQGVHSHLGDDARAHLTVLPAVERENRTLAPVAQTGVQGARFLGSVKNITSFPKRC